MIIKNPDQIILKDTAVPAQGELYGAEDHSMYEHVEPNKAFWCTNGLTAEEQQWVLPFLLDGKEKPAESNGSSSPSASAGSNSPPLSVWDFGEFSNGEEVVSSSISSSDNASIGSFEPLPILPPFDGTEVAASMPDAVTAPAPATTFDDVVLENGQIIGAGEIIPQPPQVEAPVGLLGELPSFNETMAPAPASSCSAYAPPTVVVTASSVKSEANTDPQQQVEQPTRKRKATAMSGANSLILRGREKKSRFQWTVELHCQFMVGIFELGLKHVTREILEETLRKGGFDQVTMGKAICTMMNRSQPKLLSQWFANEAVFSMEELRVAAGEQKSKLARPELQAYPISTAPTQLDRAHKIAFATVFDLGMAKTTPRKSYEGMAANGLFSSNDVSLTGLVCKSHLQKYRRHWKEEQLAFWTSILRVQQ